MRSYSEQLNKLEDMASIGPPVELASRAFRHPVGGALFPVVAS